MTKLTEGKLKALKTQNETKRTAHLKMQNYNNSGNTEIDQPFKLRKCI